MKDQYKIQVTPKILGDSGVLISMKTYNFLEGNFALVSEPSLVTTNGKEAAISLMLNEDSKSQFTMTITPEIK